MHKENCNQGPPTSGENGDNPSEDLQISDISSEEENENQRKPIPSKFLKLLKASDKIQSMVKFKYLRDTLTRIRNSSSPYEDIEACLKDADFQMFSDELIKALGLEEEFYFKNSL